MKGRLRTFAAVGLAVTACDLGLLVALRVGAGLPILIADAIAVAVASALSYGLHRSLTFADDPHRRWVQDRGLYVAIAIAAGLLDVAAVRVAVLAGRSPADTAAAVLAAKAPALALAAAVRIGLYRKVLLTSMRGEQGQRAGRPAPPGRRRLSVVVPAFREQDRIGATVVQLRAALAPLGEAVEIVVVDDGSGDGTAGAARDAGADVVVVQPTNRGKGAAVRAGVKVASGRAIAFTDADLAYPPGQLLRLLEQVEAGWDVVVGSRRHVDTTTLVRARRLREASGRLFNLLTTLVLLGQYRDTQCGLKAFRSDVARLVFDRTRIDGFAFDVEIFHLAERYRLSLAEVPVSLANTDASTVRVGRDALRMVRDLLRIRWWAGLGRYDADPAALAALGRSEE